MNDQHLLSLAESYLQKSVFPHAAAIDSDVDALQNALSGMGQLGLLGLRVPSEWSGLEASESPSNHPPLITLIRLGALGLLCCGNVIASDVCTHSSTLASNLSRTSSGNSTITNRLCG